MQPSNIDSLINNDATNHRLRSASDVTVVSGVPVITFEEMNVERGRSESIASPRERDTAQERARAFPFRAESSPEDMRKV